jgi:hypothetical protein
MTFTQQSHWQYELRELFGNQYDEAYLPIYHAHCSDYSSCSWVYILEYNSNLYILEYNYSPEADNNEPEWDLNPISYEDALEEIDRWVGFEDDN